jgi:hypothetical protein
VGLPPDPDTPALLHHLEESLTEAGLGPLPGAKPVIRGPGGRRQLRSAGSGAGPRAAGSRRTWPALSCRLLRGPTSKARSGERAGPRRGHRRARGGGGTATQRLAGFWFSPGLKKNPPSRRLSSCRGLREAAPHLATAGEINND